MCRQPWLNSHIYSRRELLPNDILQIEEETMRILFTPKALPSLVLALQYAFFLIPGLTSALPSANFTELEPQEASDAIFQKFTFQECASDYTDMIKNAYLNVQKIVCESSAGPASRAKPRLIEFPVDCAIRLLHCGSALLGRVVD